MRILLVAATVLSTQAFSIFDAQLLVGPRRATVSVDGDSEAVNATEIQLAAHLDPIPLIPVSFGAYYNSVAYKPKADGDVFGGVDTLTGGELGLEVSAWVKLPFFDLIPYGKLGYTVWGATTIVDDNADIGDGETTKLKGIYLNKGPKMAIGLKWSPLAIVSALVEVDYHQQTWAADEVKVGDQKVVDPDDLKSKSTSILIGVEAGL